MIPDFTVVLGLDAKHLKQLELVWPTWLRHKPSLMNRPFIIFLDDFDEITEQERMNFIDDLDKIEEYVHCVEEVCWPPIDVDYGTGTTKWDNPHRHKMLAGFLYTAAEHVHTPYWLKLDTDAIARGMDDWIDPDWFANEPAIVGPGWKYTKPANQMQLLDEWAARHGFFSTPPLNLVPQPGSELLHHPRIAGWCNFFKTDFTRRCADMARQTCPAYHMPVPSLDGYTFYCAKRLDLPIVTVNMKTRGWDVRNSMIGIQEAVGRAMATAAMSQ